MKNLTKILTVFILMIAAAVPANSQLKFGLKAGASVNSFKFSNVDEFKDVFSADNRAGFTGGAMLEIGIPVVGLCVDASVMYVHRTTGFEVSTPDDNIEAKSSKNETRDYIDVPINLKYKLNIPVIAKIFKPYVTTGPNFAFLVGKNEIAEAFKTKTFDFAWNFGFGIELFSHVQLHANYGLGITNVIEKIPSLEGHSKPIETKNNCWTITAAYLF